LNERTGAITDRISEKAFMCPPLLHLLAHTPVIAKLSADLYPGDRLQVTGRGTNLCPIATCPFFKISKNEVEGKNSGDA